MRKLFSIILLPLLFGLTSFSQDIATDSKNKGVFTYYGTKKYRLDFSGKDFSLTVSSKPKNITYLPDKSNPAVINVKKKSNYYLQTSIINAADIVSLSDFSGFRPGVKFKMGYQRAVDSIFSNYKGLTYAWGGSFYSSIDNIKLYDPQSTASNKVSKVYPFTIGAELNTTIFLPIKWMALSLSGTISNGWNDNSLLNYKDISSGTIVNSNIIAFEKFEGKYGVLITGVTKGRLSFSVPLTIWQINPIPYAVLLSTSNDTPTYFLGVYTNILSEKINFHAFKLPSTFGIGIDWTKKSSGWSSGNIFIRGNINLSQF